MESNICEQTPSSPLNNPSIEEDLAALQRTIKQNPDRVLYIDQDGGNALHRACKNRAPLEEVVFLVSLEPALLKARMNLFGTPLHVSCRHNHSLEVIKFLIEEYPQALQVRDAFGRTPLHNACGNNGTHVDIVRFLMEKYPAALTIKAHGLNLPLHLACESNHSLEVITLLVEEYPEALQETDIFDGTPLHCACGSDPPLDIVMYLVEHNPDAVRAKLSAGQLPLHRACRYCRTLDVVMFLIEQYPEALDISDVCYFTPLKIAKKFNQHACIGQYLETLTVDSVKTRQAEKRIAGIASFLRKEWATTEQKGLRHNQTLSDGHRRNKKRKCRIVTTIL